MLCPFEIACMVFIFESISYTNIYTIRNCDQDRGWGENKAEMTKIISVFKLSFAENPEMIKLFRKIKSTGTSYLWARYDYFSVQFLVLSFFKFRILMIYFADLL